MPAHQIFTSAARLPCLHLFIDLSGCLEPSLGRMRHLVLCGLRMQASPVVHRMAGKRKRHTCDILSVCCRPSTAAVDVGRDVVYFLTVFVSHCGIGRRAGVCSQDDSILCESRQFMKGLIKMDTALTDHSQTIIKILKLTLNTSPAIVVPVFVNLGGLMPLASRYALRPHRSNWKPPCVIFEQLALI